MHGVVDRMSGIKKRAQTNILFVCDSIVESERANNFHQSKRKEKKRSYIQYNYRSENIEESERSFVGQLSLRVGRKLFR